MSFVTDIFKNRGWLKLVQYNTGTSGLEVAGSAITVSGVSGDKGGIRYNYKNTTSGDPGSGFFRMNNVTTSLVTSLFVDDFGAGSLDMTAFLNSWTKNGIIDIAKNAGSGSAFARFKISSAPVDSGTYYTVPVTYIAGIDFADLDACVIDYTPSANVSWDGSDLLDDTGAVISNPLTVANYAALPAANTVTAGKAYYITDLDLHYRSNGTYWGPVGKTCMYAKSAGQKLYIAPAIQATAVGNNGGFLQITAALHLLTTSPAVGASVYISAGTNWTAGFYEIKTVDSVNAYTLTLAYDAGLGVPTVALANTQVTMYSIAVHPLIANSSIDIDMSYDFTDSADDKRMIIMLDSTEMINVNFTTALTYTGHGFYSFYNNNSTSAQRTKFTKTSVGGTGSAASSTFSDTTVNTSVATTLKIDVLPAVANQVCRIANYEMRLSQ